MIIWRGLGILAAVFWVLSLAIVSFTIDSILGRGFYTNNAWPKILASAACAPIIWIVGRHLNGSPESIERKTFGPTHTFFFVPMEYWGPIFLALGIIVALLPRDIVF